MKLKMKKVLILTLLMIWAICGCGKKDEAATVSKNPKVRLIDVDDIIIQEEKEFLISIDPGHQGWDVDMSAMEPNAPGSSVMKMKATSGTAGRFSSIPEFQLNLDISLMLRDALVDKGYEVIMTREDNQTAISNSERAMMANEAGADVSIRIHANGSENSGASGALALITSPANPYTGHLYEQSDLFATCVLNSYCEATGFANLGIQQNDTMTGINWSKIPVMILEMGFMTNEHDDLKMADTEFRKVMVDGIVNGIEKYYEETHSVNSKAAGLDELGIQLEEIVSDRVNSGEQWAIYVKELAGGADAAVGNAQMESASLIKLFTAVTVFKHWEDMKSQEQYEGETLALMEKMICVSDNDAANTLVRRLGWGDAYSGMQKVNEYCRGNGYTETYMGRLMLDFDSTDDNYTSVKDCGKLLENIYNNNNVEGSETILQYMKKQERVGKIPAGLPQGAASANKTGELTDVENDVAIVFGEKTDYIICVMSGGLSDTYSARSKIVEVSAHTYQYIEK